MSNYLDKWNEFIAEEDDVRDTYDDEVEKRNEKSRKQGAEKMGLEERCQKGYKTHPTQKTKKMYGKTYRNCIKAEGEEKVKELEIKIRKALRDEGGAAGMDALVKHTEASEKEIKDAIRDMDGVGRHEDGDYILEDGEGIDVLEEAMDPKKIKKLEQEYLRTKSNAILVTFNKLVKAGKYDKQRLFKLKKAAEKRNMSETLQDLDEKKKKKKRDACYHKVKSRYKVWPSAYASGALVKCRKVGAKNWGNKSKKKNEGLDIDLVASQIAEIFANENKLRNWFKGGGWKQIGGKYDGKPCAKQPGQKTKPKCASPAKAASMSDKERENAAKRKRAQDPNPDRKGKAKNVNTDPKKESVDMKITKEELNQIIFEKTREVYYETFIFPQLADALFEDGTSVDTQWLHELLDEASCDCPHLVYEAEYQGRKVTLNKPTRGDVKKFKVYVKDPKTGNVKKVNFGHGGSSAKKKGEKTMKIRKSNPKARKSFRARHNCDNPGPKTKARYWSCKKW